MHTGYDNYWMYRNRRHELVLCFPKNDSFSHPVCTNSYKQVQGMGNPSNLYNYIQQTNTVARRHQKLPNDQHKVTSTESMWPSSIYLQPYLSSNTHNILPQEVCSIQSNGICDSSQPLQSQVLRNVENNNVNFNAGQVVNCKTSAGPVNNQGNLNYKAQANRIRVKDVSSLNNDKNGNYNSLLGIGLHQVQQERQHYYHFDSTTIGQNRIYNNGQTQRDCANLGSAAVSDLSQSYQNYGPLAGHTVRLNNEEQYPQPSTGFYQQNAQFTCERQPCFNNVHQSSEKPPQDLSRENYPTQSGKNLNKNGFRETDEQRVRLNSEAGSNNNACASESNASNLSGLSKSNEINAISQIQPALSETIQTSPQNPIDSANKSHAEAIAKSSFHNPLIGPDISTVKITIPSPIQSTKSRSDSSFSEPSRNSVLCLLLENSDTAALRGKFSRDKAQKDALETSQKNEELSGSGNAYSGLLQLNNQQEPVAGLGAQHKENRNLAAENPPGQKSSEICEQFSRRETVVVFQGERALDCSIKPKVENLDPEKDSLESANANCTEEVLTIKSEVDFLAKNHNTEHLSDPYFLEVTELSDTENAEDIDLLPLKNPGTESETTSAALNDNRESEMHDVILEETGNCTEKSITIEDADNAQEVAGNGEVSALEEGKCKSEINRDKLDLLIKFLKKDGGEPVEIETHTENSCSPPLTNPQREKVQKQRRRKLCKTSVVKNKNTEREMISLVSYKGAKYSEKSSSTRYTSNESAEIKSGRAENGPTEDFDCLGDSRKTIPKEKQPEESNDDLSGWRQQAVNMSSEGKPLEETTGNGSSVERGITTEERNIINIMRAFQNLKNHFCASCDFISPVESIWINVVSGELRCLNCFKKMMLKADENGSNSKKKCTADGVNTLKALDIHDGEEGDEGGNEEEKNFEKESNYGSDIPENDALKSEDLIEFVKEEVGMLCEYDSEDWKEQDGENRITERERYGPIQVQVSDEQVRSEAMIRGEKSARANGTEEYVSERLTKKGGNQALGDDSGKRSDSDEGDAPSQEQIVEEDEEEYEKDEASGESKVPHSMEGCIEERSHNSKAKEGKMEHEPKRKGDDVSEKPKSKRKRETPEGETGLRESLILGGCEKGKPRGVRRSSKTFKGRKESEENAEKNKIATETGMEGGADDLGAGKSRINNALREECQSQGIREEDSDKEVRPNLISRPRKRSSWSQRRRARAESSDPTYVPPKRIAKGLELTRLRRKYVEIKPQDPYLARNQTKESEHEQKTDRCSEKMPDSSDSEKSSEKSAHSDVTENPYRKSKQCLISRLFKGKQNTRMKCGFTAGGARKVPEVGKEHRRQGMNEEKNDYHNRVRSKSFYRKAESSSEKSGHSTSEESTDGKSHQQKKREDAKGKGAPAIEKSFPKERQDKTVGCIFGAIIEKDAGGSLQSKNLDEITYSTTLLARLMKKTKKLSLSLLEKT